MKGADVEREVAIEWVKVVGRFRNDLGDIASLAASISQQGLINAITITPSGELLAGCRRLEACRSLGWRDIPARIVDSLDDAAARLRVERDENTERKEMLVSERVALAQALEELEKPKAERRMHEGGIRGRAARYGAEAGPGSPEHRPTHTATKARDIAGAAAGLPGSSYYRAAKVVEIATDSAAAPAVREAALAALAEMDSTGAISPAYDKVRAVRESRPGPVRQSINEAKSQRRAVTGAVATLSGISHILRQIDEIHEDITSEEAAQWVGDLSQTRLVIERLIKRLKERTNG